MKRNKYAVALFGLVLILAACGEGDEQAGNEPAVTAQADAPAATESTASPRTDAPATTAQAEQEQSEPANTPEVTEMGSFTVDGTEFAVTLLNRCIPFSGPDSEEIDLQPIAQGQGAQLFLYGTADSLEVSVQGSAVEEIGGTNAFAADPFGDGEIRSSSIDAGRWTGEATLNDSYGSDATVEVSWDVSVPEEINDCGL